MRWFTLLRTEETKAIKVEEVCRTQLCNKSQWIGLWTPIIDFNFGWWPVILFSIKARWLGSCWKITSQLVCWIKWKSFRYNFWSRLKLHSYKYRSSTKSRCFRRFLIDSIHDCFPRITWSSSCELMREKTNGKTIASAYLCRLIVNEQRALLVIRKIWFRLYWSKCP